MAGKKQATRLDRDTPEDFSLLSEVAALLKVDGPPGRFLLELLSLQCRLVEAESSAVLRIGENAGVEVLAAYPPASMGGRATDWIGKISPLLEKVLSSGHAAISPLDPLHGAGKSARRHVIVLPIKKDDHTKAVAAFVVSAEGPMEIAAIRERLELISFLGEHRELQMSVKQGRKAMWRLSLTLEIVSVVNRANRFMSAAMALCNEFSDRLECRRVSLGILDGRYVRARAMSRTDTFGKEMKLTQDIEAVMEECLDQNIEVLYPPRQGASEVCRAAKHFAKQYGPIAVLSLPIRQNDELSGVLTLERTPENPFTLEEIETIRLACDLCSPRLIELQKHDKWFGARVAEMAREKMTTILGSQHTWIKVWAVLILLLVGWVTFAKGDYRVDSPFVFEATVQQSVVAPFDTFIKEVRVEPGDSVEAEETILGRLDTSELRLELASLKAEHLGYLKQRAAAMRDGKTAGAQIAQAQSDKLAADIRLTEFHRDQATLVAPISGWIVSEDLKRQLGAPVETGDVLFEIARIDSLRADLYVPEEAIAQVTVGNTGELASVGRPDQKIRFTVEQINPIAGVVSQKNVFKVRAKLHEQAEWMRPGMEGIAKISMGKKRYLWIWTHRLADWLRMKLWI